MPLLHGVSGSSIGPEFKMIPHSRSERNVIYGRPPPTDLRGRQRRGPWRRAAGSERRAARTWCTKCVVETTAADGCG